MWLQIQELDPGKFRSTPSLAWQGALKRTNVKLEFLANINMLLMVEKGIRDGLFHSIKRYVKANSRYTKNYDKNKESPHLKYCYVNNLYGWAM